MIEFSDSSRVAQGREITYNPMTENQGRFSDKMVQEIVRSQSFKFELPSPRLSCPRGYNARIEYSKISWST